ncbi:unnamed protein product, partial [Adineta steineri]
TNGATAPVPTCDPSACCNATSCAACVYGGTTYYCHRYASPPGYNLYTSASICATNPPPSSFWCDYASVCGVGSGSPGLGSGNGC